MEGQAGRAGFGGLSGRGPRRLGVSLLEQELCSLLADLLHLGDDPGQAAAVGDPFLVEGGLGFGQTPSNGPAGVAASPLPVGAVGLGRIGVASAATGSAVGAAKDDARPLRTLPGQEEGLDSHLVVDRRSRGSEIGHRLRSPPSGQGRISSTIDVLFKALPPELAVSFIADQDGIQIQLTGPSKNRANARIVRIALRGELSTEEPAVLEVLPASLVRDDWPAAGPAHGSTSSAPGGQVLLGGDLDDDSGPTAWHVDDRSPVV